ncbi:40S_ribosomal_protein_S21_-_putative [Leishmania infantum]|uniref:40S_ribosomal_protein_S21_-_putative n=3 Tax=Leishmania donovani species complex TaxID=38574 RepID=A0A6L0WUK8_LEIIN|nr:40S_ribosomal_protein_S21_-_putative [Leishmania infantum]SUZ39858.1 40S_ribosomal_protein_S21_-_putative [Leishmania infantum]
MATIGMFNEEGENVDLYIPRKCHATNTLIEAHDHAAVQISIANVGPNGVINGTTTTLCIAGYLRSQGESDHAINHITIDRGIMRIKTGKPKRASKSKSKKPAAKGAAAGAAAQKGGRPSVQKGARPASQKGARPPTQKGARPPTQKGARPPTQKGARPPAQKGAAPARKNRA